MNETLSAVIPMLMAVIGGLGIFMLGMKYMSEGMQAVAGNSLRRMISLVTDNRLMATGAGTGVTVLVQSSTVTTVIVVGLVNAQLMQLHQAIGVIMGANIGTTITGWILVLKIGAWGLPILGVAALVYLFTRKDRPRFIAMAIMGLGMVFFGLELMKEGFAPMKDVPMFMEAFEWFRADTLGGVLRCVLAGCILTFLVQSSSATLGITIGLAATGAIPFPTAAALVLGENIGTTITVLLAGIGANTNAKRTAAAHVLFNVFGVIWIVAIFQWYIRLVAGVVEGVHGADPMTMTLATAQDPVAFAAVMTAAIAVTHSGFNITNTLLFLPFLKPFARTLERLIPEPDVREVRHLKHLDARAVSAPVLGVEQSRGEVVQMGRGTQKMMEWIRQIGFDGPRDERIIQKTFHREEVLDNIQSEIATFLTELLDASVPHAIAEEGGQQLRLAHEYESMSDRLASILRAYLKLADRQLELPPDHLEGLRQVHDEIARFLDEALRAYEQRHALEESWVQSRGQGISRQIKMLRRDHLKRMTERPLDPQLSLIYTTLLTDYRRVRAHITNVMEASVGGITSGTGKPAGEETWTPAASP
ncbi:MAG: Na/Pi cotransporter family protein [Gemmatimonadales bacterium]|nr:MAG: Na/Pi cotransporter family protein [Gemmatimonadales bacterium]